MRERGKVNGRERDGDRQTAIYIYFFKIAGSVPTDDEINLFLSVCVWDKEG